MKEVSEEFDMNLTIILAFIPAAMLLYGTIVPKSSISFWELYGWVSLVATVFLFGSRYVRARASRRAQCDVVSEASSSPQRGASSSMRVVIASDHRGVRLKRFLMESLQSRNVSVMDMGCQGAEKKVDYPDYAVKACEKVISKEADWGILICGSGIGMSIAANKVRGIRAALCRDPQSGAMAREHNDANVLVLSGDDASEALSMKILDSWMGAHFMAGRHLKRIEKVMEIERKGCSGR